MSDNQTPKLHPYYLAYIDILGVKNAINSDESEKYLEKINCLYNDVLEGLDRVKSENFFIKPEIKIFSDNIVIAIKKEYPYTFTEEIKQDLLINAVSYFQMLGLKYSFLTRGGITIENLYLNQNFIYGKALSKAYKIENDISVFPRIVIDNACVNEFIQNNLIRKCLKKDFDGTCYLDSFQKYFDLTNGEDKESLAFLQTTLKEQLEEKTSDVKAPFKKYWIINKFNEFCISNNYEIYVVNIDEYPYNPDYIRTTYSGRAKEFV